MSHMCGHLSISADPVGAAGAVHIVKREVGTFHHGQNPPPFGVGDARFPQKRKLSIVSSILVRSMLRLVGSVAIGNWHTVVFFRVLFRTFLWQPIPNRAKNYAYVR